MQLVIEISDGLYNNLDEIKNGSIASKIILNCVRKGQVLPKGYGRLIDEKVLLRKLRSRNFGFNLPTWVKVAIDNTPTIIEADKEN